MVLRGRGRNISKINHHHSIVRVGLHKLIPNPLLFQIFMESSHFPSIFDGIIDDYDTSRGQNRARKVEELPRHPEGTIDENAIKGSFWNISDMAFGIWELYLLSPG